MRPLLFILTALFLFGCDRAETEATAPSAPTETTTQVVAILSPLIDPNKLDTLTGKRAATPRLRKACYWLHIAEQEGHDPGSVIDQAHAAALPKSPARQAEQKAALLRNLTILSRLGCFDSEGLEKLRRGNAPTITRGPYAGELATGDHIIPRSVCPELDNCLFNLEFMPDTLNKRKSAKVGDRQRSLARRWYQKGLLSLEGFKATRNAAK
ncbi:MAG: hypothetical protein ACSHYB_03805 [Roseibacillus sp.]